MEDKGFTDSAAEQRGVPARWPHPFPQTLARRGDGRGGGEEGRSAPPTAKQFPRTRSGKPGEGREGPGVGHRRTTSGSGEDEAVGIQWGLALGPPSSRRGQVSGCGVAPSWHPRQMSGVGFLGPLCVPCQGQMGIVWYM